MDDPTLDQVRAAKADILRRFQGVKDFAGAGIGESGGRLSVRVNWRALPTGVSLPSSIGDVEITHHEVGDIAPQSE